MAPHPFERANPAVDKSQYKYPRLSDAEYERRHRRIHTFLEDENLDALLIAGGGSCWDRCWTNIAYVTNWLGTMELSAYCIFPRQGEPTITCLTLNGHLPDRAARGVIDDIRGGLDYALMAADRLRELGLEHGRIGIVEVDRMISLPMNHYKTLTQELSDAVFEVVTDKWWNLRREKSDEEIVELKRAAQWADEAFLAMVNAARPGLSERELFNAAYETIYRLGADYPSMMLIASGPMGRLHTSFQRNRPVERLLEKGDIIFAELGPRTATGYEAQMGNPISLGPLTEHYERMWERCLDAYERVSRALRPGNTPTDVWEAGRRAIADFGYVWTSPLIHGMYGIPSDSPRVLFRQPTAHDPFIHHQMLTIEIHVSPPERTSGIFAAVPVLLKEGRDPKPLNTLPLQCYVV